MNKNTKQKRDRALDAFHRTNKSESDVELSKLIGNRPRVHKGPKVAKSAAAITQSVGRNRA